MSFKKNKESLSDKSYLPCFLDVVVRLFGFVLENTGRRWCSTFYYTKKSDVYTDISVKSVKIICSSISSVLLGSPE